MIRLAGTTSPECAGIGQRFRSKRLCRHNMIGSTVIQVGINFPGRERHWLATYPTIHIPQPHPSAGEYISSLLGGEGSAYVCLAAHKSLPLKSSETASAKGVSSFTAPPIYGGQKQGKVSWHGAECLYSACTLPVYCYIVLKYPHIWTRGF